MYTALLLFYFKNLRQYHLVRSYPDRQKYFLQLLHTLTSLGSGEEKLILWIWQLIPATSKANSDFSVKIKLNFVCTAGHGCFSAFLCAHRPLFKSPSQGGEDGGESAMMLLHFPSSNTQLPRTKPFMCSHISRRDNSKSYTWSLLYLMSFNWS